MNQARAPSIMLTLACLLACTSQVDAQISYSIDEQGPTNGLLDPGGLGPISGGDILVPTPPVGPLPPPTIFIPIGPGGLGVVPTALGFNEVDALSYGIDDVIYQQQTSSFYYFSVDEFAIGLPGPPPFPPNVTTEGAGPIGALEASADVYVFPPGFPVPPGPIGPGPVFGNTGLYDGNGGITPFASPTLNLVEPNPPTPGMLMGPDPGDNLDALDVDTPDFTAVYFSLDSMFPDPLEVPPGAGPPPNTGTALANGFVGGDVLLSAAPGGPLVLYAAAVALGLDLMGTETDDLDALILNDLTDGIAGTYTPTAGPYSWLVGTDMLLYSVRRNSALIGTPDAIFGAPIEEGDILVPMGPGAVPGIWIAAEALGLATVRSGAAAVYPFPNPQWGGTFVWADDLNALDHTHRLVPEPTALLLAIVSVVMIGSLRRRSFWTVDS